MPDCLIIAFIALITAPPGALAQQLPPGGTTSWEIQEPEEIVTFVLFDPKAPGMSLPHGLRFVSARDAQMPEIQEYLKQHPEHAEWSFSFIEITRQKAFLLDGRAPVLPKDGGIALWFAPVDASQLAKEIRKDAFDSIIAPSLGAVLGLGIWIPDREYVAYMRARGHHAEYGLVTLVKDGTGAFQGEIRLDNLHVRSSATPHGDVREDPASGTQVLFAPGDKVEHAIVVAGSKARHRTCDAVWSKQGNHPLSRGVLVGPTYMTTYEEPLKGSAYRLRETAKQWDDATEQPVAADGPDNERRVEMKIRFIPAAVTLAGVLGVVGGWTVIAQDKYTLQVPDGIAFSEFKGYETWQVVSLSHSDETLNVIVANPVMIDAYAAGIPGNGKPFPDGSMAVKIQYIPKKSAEAPFNVEIPDRLKDVAFMLKDSKRFADSSGWGFAMFNYDPASDRFTPDGKGYKCGTACHAVAKAKDTVFTEYGKR